MQRAWLGSVLLAASVASAAHGAQTALSPVLGLPDMDFQQGEVGKPPPGWGGKSISTIKARSPEGGKILQLQNDEPTPANFGRSAPASSLRGEYIRFRADVRTLSAAGAGLWLRIDGPRGQVLFLDNMSDRLVYSPDWRQVEIKTEVPAAASRIVIGGLIFGKGAAEFADASLDVLPASADPITPDAQAYLDKALDALEDHHLNKHSVDWRALRTLAEAAAAHAQRPSDTYGAIRLAIRALGEKHTLLILPHADMEAMAAGPSPTPLSVKVVHPGIVQLTLPGTGDPVGAAYAATLRAGIYRHQDEGVCGWIVDLRNDTGGNVWPMLKGLAPLLGPPPWGGFQDADGQLQAWTYKDGSVTAAPVNTWPEAAPSGVTILKPLAVLLGPRTTSAGEMIAIALSGRADARSFGARTAGFTTGNGLVPLPDGAALAVTTSHELDRSGKVVNGALTPDQQTDPAHAEAAALDWLTSRGCR